jgi:hypothetical protein
MASMISKALEKFMNLPQEDFTSIIITAISMGELHETFLQEDKDRLKWIEKYTCDDLMTSIYKLDRKVDPTQTTGDPTQFQYKIQFYSDELMDEEDGGRLKIKLKSDDLQDYLCIAVREVNQIILRNFKDYNDEFAMPKREDEGDAKW